MNKYISMIATALVLPTMWACTEDSPITNPPVQEEEPIVINHEGFAKGADVSWLTELEYKGYTFANADGEQMECMQLLRDECGVDAIRLRVWVNPTEGWNNVADVAIKARRANLLGLRLMIDFHFSDTWADPASQTIPAAWADMTLDEVLVAMTAHINDMLGRLKAMDIEPEWVQIGNETRSGMMWPLGSTSENPGNFTKMVNAGYDAVKAIFPDCKVIVHIDSGDQWYLYSRIFGNELRAYGANYDIIGISLYPDPSAWETTIDSAISNINLANSTYGKPVMVVEIGMDYTQGEACKGAIQRLIDNTDSSIMQGIFYWEPEAPAGYNGGYKKGCFEDGVPTCALDPFKTL